MRFKNLDLRSKSATGTDYIDFTWCHQPTTARTCIRDATNTTSPCSRNMRNESEY